MIGALVLLLSTGRCEPARSDEPVYEIDIPSMSAAEALNRFAEQTGAITLYSYDLASARRTNAVRGRYTLLEGLEILLRGTGLSGGLSNKRVVSVSDTGSSQRQGEETPVIIEKTSFQNRVKAFFAAMLATSAASAQEVKSDSRSIEEVIVTAQRREERLQDVPISVAVVSAEDIGRRGLVSSEDYLRGIPGVSQEGRLGGMQAIVIRGLETAPASQNYSAGTTVATYFGETPTTSTAGVGGDTSVDIKLVDIQRVEVLRGPQGTAFGNSSLGGAVRTIPTPAKLDTLEGHVKAMIGTTSGNGGEDTMAQGVVNLPLVKEKLALRAVGYRYENSGFYKNVAGSDAAYQAGDVARYGAQAFATDADNAGAEEFVGGRVTALFQATDRWSFTVNYLNQKTETDGMAVAGLASTGGYTQAMYQVAPEHVRDGRKQGWTDMDIRIANVTTEYDLGWGQLVASYSDTSSGTDYGYPLTVAAADWAASIGLRSSHEEQNTELRLATQFKGPLNFLVGVYHEKTRDHADYTYWYFGDPATNDICGAACIGLRYFGQFDRTDWLQQKAVFGEATWEIVDGLTLTGGARRYDFDRRIQFNYSGPLFGNSPTDSTTDAPGDTYRGNLSYKINPSTMVYASWAQGFRLGKPQAPLAASVCDRNNDGILDGSTDVTVASTGVVTSDTVDSLELGIKVSLGRQLTISADVFSVDWTDVPVRAYAPGEPLSNNDDGNGCGRAYTTNAGEARSEGFELQATWQVNDAFRVDLGGSHIDARLTKDAPGLLPPAFKGDRLPGSAKVNANLGLQYEFDVSGREAYVRTDAIYAGSFYNDFAQTPDLKAGGYVKVDATGGIAFGSLSVELLVRNLTNRDDFTNRDVNLGAGPDFGYRLRPRSYGLQLGYSF